jgi:hypothetical protein
VGPRRTRRTLLARRWPLVRGPFARVPLAAPEA